MKHIVLVLIVILGASVLMADQMPDFKLPDMTNTDVTLAELLEKGPILIDFWEVSCTPCRTAMPYLNDLHNTYEELTVVMVSIDAPARVNTAKNFLRGRNYDFVTLFDSNKSLAQMLGVDMPPHAFLVDTEGNIVYSHVSFEPGTEMEYAEEIEKLLHPTEDAD